MNPQHPVTKASFATLKDSLKRFGNTLNVHHMMALCALLDTMTKMAEGDITGRWAFGLPTGTGKTRAIIEWSTAVYKLKLPYTLAVSASRIEALCTLKREMIENGIPEEMIGLLHDDAKASLKATADNDDRPFMLITHQRIRSKASNLSQYNLYQGQPRHLLIYDESLMVSDVEHFNYADLTGALAHAIYKHKHDMKHVDISNYLVECLQVLEYVYERYDEAKHDLHLIPAPGIEPRIAEHYAREWEKEGIISQFLRSANLDLRMVKSGQAAIVSYRIVIPAELKNMIVLDASYPIRKLCLFDSTIQNAETLPSLKGSGVRPFHELKRFDKVTINRLRSFGGRHSMEKRFKDKSMAKEVVEVLKTIPESESVLCFLYKCNQPGGTDYRKILAQEIQKAGIDLDAMTSTGHPRISIQTWGNETSLNCYAHCTHVFLVGILHRDDTELMGLYLGQTNDIKGEVDKKKANELQLSEKAHLAYQALSRGTCRTVSNGQAQPMTGYIVEVDQEIETTLTTVMPGVKWQTWKPYFMPESEDLIVTWAKKVREYLAGLDSSLDRVSSRSIRKALKADKIAPATWTLIIRSLVKPHTGSKNTMGNYEVSEWRLEGQSLVRVTAEAYGFAEEVA
ncbi:MAG: hypothetical protein NDI90_15530 [Nitrospira sp. BO4]|jgi:hypothetical protein|nr:hypothetical protein [Nitrospira sp. BO4]